MNVELNRNWKDELSEPQIETIREILPMLWAASFTDVIVRVNGQEKRYEADWIKHLFTRG